MVSEKIYHKFINHHVLKKFENTNFYFLNTHLFEINSRYAGISNRAYIWTILIAVNKSIYTQKQMFDNEKKTENILEVIYFMSSSL